MLANRLERYSTLKYYASETSQNLRNEISIREKSVSPTYPDEEKNLLHSGAAQPVRIKWTAAHPGYTIKAAITGSCGFIFKTSEAETAKLIF